MNQEQKLDTPQDILYFFSDGCMAKCHLQANILAACAGL